MHRALPALQCSPPPFTFRQASPLLRLSRPGPQPQALRCPACPAQALSHRHPVAPLVPAGSALSDDDVVKSHGEVDVHVFWLIHDVGIDTMPSGLAARQFGERI